MTETLSTITEYLRVQQVERLSTHAALITFEPHPAIGTYRAGQYLTLSVIIDGAPHPRSYSLVTVPELDDAPTVLVKREPGGLVSNYLNDRVAPGDRIAATGPAGRFTLHDDDSRPLALIGGGSGVAPLYALARCAMHRSPQRPVRLLVANRSPDTILMREHLNNLLQRPAHRFSCRFLVDDGVLDGQWTGRLSTDNAAARLTELISPDRLDHAVFYLCGPVPMMDLVANTLQQLGVPAHDVRRESFTAPTAPGRTRHGNNSRIHVYNGDSTRQLVVDDGQSILDAAIEAGLFWQYSCSTGDCGTCRVRLRQGRVHMTNLNGLTEEEEADGYVLTCVGYPTTDDVRIEP